MQQTWAACRSQKSRKAKQDAIDPSLVPAARSFPKPFGIDRHRVHIKANAEENLKGSFLPFVLGQHTCSIVFEDVSCGKFVYEVTGDTSLPQPFNKFKFQVSWFLGPCLCAMAFFFCVATDSPVSALLLQPFFLYHACSVSDFFDCFDMLSGVMPRLWYMNGIDI